jgi:hypothetical protein
VAVERLANVRPSYIGERACERDTSLAHGSLRSALLRSIGAPLACSSGTILVHSVTNMHYTGAADIAVSFVTLIKSKAYVAHYFGTLNAIVFVTRPGQTGCF